MAEGGLAERVLRREKIAVLVLIGVLFVLAGLYTVYGVGMRMTALDMTTMRSMRDMPGPGIPGDWSLGYALLVFLMWWVMMIAMMLPGVAPTVLLHAALLRRGAQRRASRRSLRHFWRDMSQPGPGSLCWPQRCNGR